MAITIGSNIASLKAQRRLSESTGQLGRTFERLSSGQRINRASDDAAGLAIAAKLNSDSRVYTQGIRNLNDGLSVLNIAEGVLREASSTITRLKELATQAANGPLNFKQRASITKEAVALVDEYNRIINSTEFNSGTKIMDGSLQNFVLQGGYGSDGRLSLSIGDKLSRTVGNGTFQDLITLDLFGDYNATAFGDFNGDGYGDFVGASPTTGDITTLLGNGDGTFRVGTSFDCGFIDAGFAASSGIFPLGQDLNNDGKLDLVGSSSNGLTLFVALGNGDGTFKQVSTRTASSYNMALADINGDGNMDIVQEGIANGIIVALGNGDGTFKASTTSSTTAVYSSYSIGDVNNDGYQDIIAEDRNNSSTMHVLFGAANGAFSDRAEQLPYSMGGSSLGDTNGDGKLDLILSADGISSIRLGNGDGTFGTARTLEGTTLNAANILSDLNGDGVLDLSALGIDLGSGNVRTFHFLGNGDGTFAGSQIADSLFSFAVADFNGDGAVDALGFDPNTGVAGFEMSNTTRTNTMARLSLYSRTDALSALGTIDGALSRITSELAQIGSGQSRIQTALGNLAVSSENFKAAESRIRDVDVASESAQLVRSQILREVGAAVLAQANTLPELAIKLLNG